MPPKANPFTNIAGVTPCPGGWLVLPARLAGVTVVAEEAFVLRTLLDVLDHRPRFDFAGINAPMGWRDEPGGKFRECDELAREMVGWPRMVGIPPVPSRAALKAPTPDDAMRLEPWLTRDDFRRFRWFREAERDIQPFHQRSWFSANPDLSFVVMNGDQPLRTSPFHEDGVVERIELIRKRLPGVDEVVSRTPPQGAGLHHMLQAASMLWTGRRASGRAVNRLPLDPNWDEAGMRMELVR
jgi:predicted RNase H-like nuclease